MGLLCGFLAVMAIIIAFVFTVRKKHLMGVLFGVADMVLVILSAQGFLDMMLASGKILSPELFGFGYEKPVFFTYVIMFVIGLVFVFWDICGIIKNKAHTAHV